MHRLVSHSKQRSINKFVVTVRIVISGSVSTCCIYGTTIRSISSSSYLDLSKIMFILNMYVSMRTRLYEIVAPRALLNQEILFVIPINTNDVS